MYVRVEVTPASKKDVLEVVSEDALKIRVREKAERNMANNRVRELVARHFGVELGSVRIISGHRSRRKIFDIETT